MQKYFLTLRYRGTDYGGWQRQHQVLTLQQILEEAILQLFGERATVVGAGRTDAGVHALGQCCQVTLNKGIKPPVLVRALNSILPRDVRILKARAVPMAFHVIRDVQHKAYLYFVHAAGRYDVFIKDYCWHVPYALDARKMRAALKFFVGRHDFASFCAAGSSAKSFVREITQATLREQNHFIFDQPVTAGKIYCCRFVGQGFLKQMVRNLVGTVVDVGRGHIAVSDLPRILHAKDRRQAGVCAPPQGLFLQKVSYRNLSRTQVMALS